MTTLMVIAKTVTYLRTLPQITGASGYLGAHIVQEALRDGYRVRL